MTISGDSEAVDVIARDWSRCVCPGDGSPGVPVVVGPPTSGGQVSTPWLASRITREGIEGLAGRQLLFHACGLSLDDGGVLVLVGPSGAGKSTASVALARRAFGYVSDETVAIDSDHTVTPYPKPLLIRSRATSPKDVVGPDELGLRQCAENLSATRLVLLRRDDTMPARLSRVPLIDSIMALIPETSALARLDNPLASLCRLIDRCGGVRALHYTEISDTESALVDLMGDETTQSDTWVQLPREPRSRADGQYGETPWLVVGSVQDAVQVGDEVLLLHDSRPVHLQGVGASLWLRSLDGATEAMLLDAVVSAHGDHHQAERIVQAAIAQLVERGVLSRYPSSPAE